MPYPIKPKGGVVVNKSTAQIWEKKTTQKFANKYKEIFQNNMAEGQNDPQGPFFYQEGGKTYAHAVSWTPETACPQAAHATCNYRYAQEHCS